MIHEFFFQIIWKNRVRLSANQVNNFANTRVKNYNANNAIFCSYETVYTDLKPSLNSNATRQTSFLTSTSIAQLVVSGIVSRMIL